MRYRSIVSKVISLPPSEIDALRTLQRKKPTNSLTNHQIITIASIAYSARTVLRVGNNWRRNRTMDVLIASIADRNVGEKANNVYTLVSSHHKGRFLRRGEEQSLSTS